MRIKAKILLNFEIFKKLLEISAFLKIEAKAFEAGDYLNIFFRFLFLFFALFFFGSFSYNKFSYKKMCSAMEVISLIRP